MFVTAVMTAVTVVMTAVTAVTAALTAVMTAVTAVTGGASQPRGCSTCYYYSYQTSCMPGAILQWLPPFYRPNRRWHRVNLSQVCIFWFCLKSVSGWCTTTCPHLTLLIACAACYVYVGSYPFCSFFPPPFFLFFSFYYGLWFIIFCPDMPVMLQKTPIMLYYYFLRKKWPSYYAALCYALHKAVQLCWKNCEHNGYYA